jgi:hypothetical protein
MFWSGGGFDNSRSSCWVWKMVAPARISAAKGIGNRGRWENAQRNRRAGKFHDVPLNRSKFLGSTLNHSPPNLP